MAFPTGTASSTAPRFYDPATGRWTFTGDVNIAREGNLTGVLLHDGRVLMVGGEGPWNKTSPQAELYDPATGRWSITGSYANPRWSFELSLLDDGRVLLIGGSANNTAYPDAQVYDPSTGQWSRTGSLHVGRVGFGVATLADGRVLVAGGTDARGNPILQSEIYDPSTGKWSLDAPLLAPHTGAQLVSLNDGCELITGGWTGGAHSVPTTDAEIYKAPQAAGASPGRPIQASPGQLVAYVASGVPYVKPISGGPARVLGTPWPAQGLQWAPDGSRIAVMGTAGQLAVVDPLDGTKVVLSEARSFERAWWHDDTWSPNGRYLAFPKEVTSADTADLWIWDRMTGQAQRMASRFALPAWSSLAWSHDSTRLVVAEGATSFRAGMPASDPELVVLSLKGDVLARIGQGAIPSWSPDDRLIAYSVYSSCTNTSCSGRKMVMPAGGGRATLLDPAAEWMANNNQWVSLPGGYVFDRWLLDRSGHILRTVVPPADLVLAWAPNGRHVLASAYTSNSQHYVLKLVAVGSVTREVYTGNAQMPYWAYYGTLPSLVVWQPDSSGFAFADLLDAYRGLQEPACFVFTIGSGSLQRLAFPGYPTAFVDGDRGLILQQPLGAYPNRTSTLYLYSLQSHRPSMIASGVGTEQGATYSSFALQPVAPPPQQLDSLLAAIEHLRATSDKGLDQLQQGEAARRQAVLYFRQHLKSDALQGAATIILDALSAGSAAKDLWQGSLHDFIGQMSLTNTKALVADAARHLGKDAAKHLAKAGYDAGVAGLVDWLITGDPRAGAALSTQIQADKQQVDAAAKAAEAAVRAHPPSTSQARAMEAALASVTSANNRLAGELEALSNLLTTAYTLRSSSDKDTTVFDNFFADTALCWSLTALSLPVGGWGGLAYKGTKLAFQALQALGKEAEDAQLVSTATATSLSGIPLAASITTNAKLVLAGFERGKVPPAPTGSLGKLVMQEQAALLQTHTATLDVPVRAGKVGAIFQAVVTYQHAQHTLPVPQGAYPVTYLAKSAPVVVQAGKAATLHVDFLPGGSGTPPSAGTPMTITVLALEGNRVYYVGQTSMDWRPV